MPVHNATLKSKELANKQYSSDNAIIFIEQIFLKSLKEREGNTFDYQGQRKLS